jgi:hypothetical protein
MPDWVNEWGIAVLPTAIPELRGKASWPSSAGSEVASPSLNRAPDDTRHSFTSTSPGSKLGSGALISPSNHPTDMHNLPDHCERIRFGF